MYDRCIFLYDHLSIKCPEERGALYCNISMCLVRMQRYKEAESYARKSIACSPNNEKFIYRLSYCLWKLGRPDEAKVPLTKIKDLCPNSKALLAAINKELAAKAEQLDFSSRLYCRMQAPLFKKLYFEIDPQKQYELVLTDS